MSGWVGGWVGGDDDDESLSELRNTMVSGLKSADV